MKTFFLNHLKAFRITAAVIAFVMIAGLLFFANELVGNPVSYFLVKHNAEKYVAENYADEGYVLESVNYNWKVGSYYTYISKPGSEDNRFFVSYGINGKKGSDNYKISDQISGNVRTRLEMRYRELVNSVLESPSYPYSSDFSFGKLIFEPYDYEGRLDEEYDYALPKSILVPDGLYDITELGAKAGKLTIYVDAEGEETLQKTAETLLEINSLMERGGVTFYAIDFRYGFYRLNHFLRSDIYEDGLVERVKENWMKTNAKYEASEKAAE